MRRDPYQWHDAFDLLDNFDHWAEDLEERHRIEMLAVNRSAWESAMEVRHRYERLLQDLTDKASITASLLNPTLILGPRW